jgi:toxin ParE1/3/4
MARRPVHLHAEAVTEARAAAQWYGEQNISAAEAFLKELDGAVEKIAEAPEMYPPYIGGPQRFLMRRFPFGVIYRERAGAIEIIAIAHQRRKPGYWKGRSV